MWLRRWASPGAAPRSGGTATSSSGIDGLHDRSSRPRRSPTRAPDRIEERICRRRRAEKVGPDRLAIRLGLPASTIYRVLRRHDLHRLGHLDRQTGDPIRRYERSRPGELVHVDVKKLGQMPAGGGHKVHGRAGDQRQSPTPRCRHRLHLPAHRYRRPQPPRLHRGARRRAGPHRGRLLAPGRGLVPGPRGRRRAGAHRQSTSPTGACSSTPQLAERCSSPQVTADALPAPDQRQGRALPPDAARGVGLRAPVLARDTDRTSRACTLACIATTITGCTPPSAVRR